MRSRAWLEAILGCVPMKSGFLNRKAPLSKPKVVDDSKDAAKGADMDRLSRGSEPTSTQLEWKLRGDDASSTSSDQLFS